MHFENNCSFSFKTERKPRNEDEAKLVLTFSPKNTKIKPTNLKTVSRRVARKPFRGKNFYFGKGTYAKKIWWQKFCTAGAKNDKLAFFRWGAVP